MKKAAYCYMYLQVFPSWHVVSSFKTMKRKLQDLKCEWENCYFQSDKEITAMRKLNGILGEHTSSIL